MLCSEQNSCISSYVVCDVEPNRTVSQSISMHINVGFCNMNTCVRPEGHVSFLPHFTFLGGWGLALTLLLADFIQTTWPGSPGDNSVSYQCQDQCAQMCLAFGAGNGIQNCMLASTYQLNHLSSSFVGFNSQIPKGYLECQNVRTRRSKHWC